VGYTAHQKRAFEHIERELGKPIDQVEWWELQPDKRVMSCVPQLAALVRAMPSSLPRRKRLLYQLYLIGRLKR